MKTSIQVKLSIFIVLAMFLCAAVVGGISVVELNHTVEEYSDNYIQLLCQKNAGEINSVLSKVEQSVDTMAVNVLQELESPELLSDDTYREEYTERMRKLLENTASNNDGAISVYLRYNPEITPPTAGCFSMRESPYAELKAVEPTDMSLYAPDDREHVGWYYEPVNARKTIWMQPYWNANVDLYLISYIVPLFVDDQTVGIIGMDLDFDYIRKTIGQMKIYESGFAYLTNDYGDIIYHPTLDYGDKEVVDSSWTKYETKLNNGMNLVMTAPVKEINARRDTLINRLVVVAIAMIIVSMLFMILIVRNMLAPLKRLNKAAGMIAAGDYNVAFDKKRSKDEIGQLTTYYEQTVKTLKDYMQYVDGLAYTDSLTGVKNKNAFDAMVTQFEKDFVAGESKRFGIVLFNINGLKKVNDTEGHESGNKLIVAASRIITSVYSGSEVYRVSGDEFSVVVTDDNLDKREELFEQFKKQMKNTWEEKDACDRVSVACGWSVYNPELDRGLIEGVYKRADAAMHDNKSRMKNEDY